MKKFFAALLLCFALASCTNSGGDHTRQTEESVDNNIPTPPPTPEQRVYPDVDYTQEYLAAGGPQTIALQPNEQVYENEHPVTRKVAQDTTTVWRVSERTSEKIHLSLLTIAERLVAEGVDKDDVDVSVCYHNAGGMKHRFLLTWFYTNGQGHWATQSMFEGAIAGGEGTDSNNYSFHTAGGIGTWLGQDDK